MINVRNLILGFFIIIYVIYIRLILVRLPKSLYFFDPIKYGLIFMAAIWISISLFIIIKSIFTLYNLNKKNTFIEKIAVSFYNNVMDALRAVFQFVTDKKENSDEIILVFAKNFYSLFGQMNETFFIVINSLCKFIILGAFLFDVFYLFELRYFYKSLILLCIPLMINVIFYILRDFSYNLEDAASVFIIQENGVDQKGEPSYSFELTPENSNLDLAYHQDYFVTCSKINGYLNVYDYLTTYYNACINLILYSFYLIGWLYVIYFNFLN